ncbi:MAG: hypothetical protein NTZ80_00865 [Patescibacteria group bacterium]|nr:hypothetical protein [Patescibacteria group bacterium]
MSINIRKSNCQKRDEILIFEDYKTFPVSDTEEGKARIIKDSLLEKFDTVKNDEELQLLQNRYNQFDKLYVKYSCTYDSDSHREIQESIEIIYQKVKNYLDRGFKKKFQKNFSERLWEMYLINFFIEKKFDIEDRIADSGL